MADDFACVIYAIETDNQPRLGGIDADQIGLFGGICSGIGDFSAGDAREAISFPEAALPQHLIFAPLARNSLRIALIFGRGGPHDPHG
jgi:hypothetical protein